MSGFLSQEERASIVDGLVSADEEVRRLAVEQLLLLPSDEATPRLIEALGDESWRVRKSAVERLVARGAHDGTEGMLIECLSDGENPGRRNSAFEALVACGSRSLPRLVDELENRDVDVRKLVVDVMAAIGDPDARAALTATLSDPDANVRAAAAEALGVVGGSTEIESLLGLVTRESEDVLVRLSGLKALSSMQARVSVDRLENALEDGLLRPAAFELLGFSPDPGAVDRLCKALSSTSRSSRDAAIGALLRLLATVDVAECSAMEERIREAGLSVESLVDECCDRLQGTDLALRMTLVQFLGVLADDRATLALLEAGRDEALQELCDATLASFGQGVPARLEPVWGELDVTLKGRASAILGMIGGSSADSMLVGALNSSDPVLRARAAQALADGGYFARLPEMVARLDATTRGDAIDAEDEVETIIAAVVDLARHPNAPQAGFPREVISFFSERVEGASEPLRLAFANVLRAVGQPEDMQSVAYLMKDESVSVRRAAVWALAGSIPLCQDDPLRVALADESGSVRIAAAQVLARRDGSEVVEDLEGLLGDEDRRVAAAAIRGLGRFCMAGGSASARAMELLGRGLAAEPIVALAALAALADVADTSGAALAVTVLNRPESEITRAAVECIAQGGGEEELSELIPLLAHEDWSVRAESIQALAERSVRKSLPAMLRRLEVESDAFVRDALLRGVSRLEG